MKETWVPSPGQRSPGGGHSNPLQYSCLENPMDRGAWRAMVHRVAKSQTQLKWLSMHTHAHLGPLNSESLQFEPGYLSLSFFLEIYLKLPQEILLCNRVENYSSRGSTRRGEVHWLALSPALKSQAFLRNFEGNQLRSITVVERIIKGKLSSFQWLCKGSHKNSCHWE